MTTTIRKVLIPRYGDASVIQIVKATIAAPSARHVQVAPAYAGFSGADINMRCGTYPRQEKAPLTPGYCLVGTVKANGSGSTRFKPGDIVACLTKYDAQAELANIPEEHLVAVPNGLDLQQVTGIMLDWATAYAMVNQIAKVFKGQRVFIHGISGSVGYAIMKLAQLKGAEVSGTASERNQEAIREQGGTAYVYNNKDWMQRMKELGGVDAVFDAIGFESFDESYDILNGHGIVVGYGANKHNLADGAPTSALWSVATFLAKGKIPWRGKRTAFYLIARDQPEYQPNVKALFDLLSQGRISVPIRKIWELEEVQEAHRNWHTGSGVGATIVRISNK